MKCPNCGIVVPEIPRRTSQQNRFYWAYLAILEQETGNNASDLHEVFKRLFLPPRFITFKGKEIRVSASTTTLNKLSWSDYLDKIAAYTEIALPDPSKLKDFIANYNTLSTGKYGEQ